MRRSPDTWDMNAADKLNGTTQDKAATEETPVAERLETALGGDLTRFLLSALAPQTLQRGGR